MTGWSAALLALLVMGLGCLGCKDVDQWQAPAVERKDGSADGRGGAGGAGGTGAGTGGNIGNTDPVVPDANQPVDAPVTTDGAVEALTESGSPDPLCTANLPCTEGIAPCHRGVTTCASPTARAACVDAGPDDSRGGCSGAEMCKGGMCVAPPPATCEGKPIGSGRCSGTIHQVCGGNGQWVSDASDECKGADGGQCSTGTDCKSGNCAGGICCDSPCTGKCMSCSASDTGGANGNCRPVRAGSDPRNQCATSSESSCGTDGSCDGAGDCRLHGTSVVCAPATCSNGSATPVRRCNGSGSCGDASSTSCSPFACAGSACAKDCADGFVLEGSRCVACGGSGQPCCKKGSLCRGGSLICSAATDLGATKETCETCGGPGAPCCNGQRTNRVGGATTSGSCPDDPNVGKLVCEETAPNGWWCTTAPF